MNRLLLLLLFSCISYGAVSQAQVTVRGVVYDSVFHTPLSPVSIENMTTHQGCFSNYRGEFELKAALGDYIVFTHVGYAKKVIRLKVMDNIDKMVVYMITRSNTLKPVTITRGPTEYQKDSANRAEIYDRVFEYEQEKSVFSPVSSVYQKFSKKHKNIRKFKEQIITNEQQKFIDTRYTPELVKTLTKLDGDERASFINQYPMEYEYARAATELEIKMWIKYNFQDYIKKGRPPFVPKPQSK